MTSTPRPTFTWPTIISFAHCDAAGIVFYPRYFEMLNTAMEAWFADMGYDFRTMHMQANSGIPTKTLEVTFTAPSRLGDRVEVHFFAEPPGRTSLAYRYVFVGDDGVQRLAGTATLIHITDGRPAPWPEAVRSRLPAPDSAAA